MQQVDIQVTSEYKEQTRSKTTAVNQNEKMNRGY